MKIIKNLVAFLCFIGVGMGAGHLLKDIFKPSSSTVIDSAEVHFSNTTHKVVIYTTEWCPYCKKLKSFLKEKNVEFLERDIENGGEEVKRLFDLIGSSGIPKVIIGNKVIHGFDKQSVLKELELNGLI